MNDLTPKLQPIIDCESLAVTNQLQQQAANRQHLTLEYGTAGHDLQSGREQWRMSYGQR